MDSSGVPLTQAGEFFNTWSETYERNVGGSTRRVARFMLSCSPTPDAGSIILDNACGSGQLAFEALELFPSSGSPRPKIHAVDIAPKMVELLKQKAGKAELPGSVLETGVMDAQDISFPDNTFTHSYMNFGIFFLPDGARGAAEIHRTLRPGGTAFVSSWEHLGYVSHIRAAQKAVRPNDELFQLPFPEEWCKEEKLRETLVAGGFAPEKIKILRTKSAMQGENVQSSFQKQCRSGVRTRKHSCTRHSRWI